MELLSETIKDLLTILVDMSKTSLANRPGTVDAAGEAADFTANTAADLAFVEEFLTRNPDAITLMDLLKRLLLSF